MIAAEPRAFRVTLGMRGQNPYNGGTVDKQIAAEQHRHLTDALRCDVVSVSGDLPDVVFMANAGLVLPRLPAKVIVLSKMKFPSRQKETPKLKKIFEEMGFTTYSATDVIEGQGEAKWFRGGELLIVGYGFRCTSVAPLRRLLGRIYRSHGVEPPRVVGVKLESPFWYHLDMAMLSVSSTYAVVHEGAFSPGTVLKLRGLIRIAQIRVDDPFCLNGICVGRKCFVHTLQRPVRELLRAVTQLELVELDVSEFEKAGGSVRCMVLDAR